MVSYGERDFREWAEENGFDDGDVLLIKRTAAKRAWLWLLIPEAFSLLSFIPGQESWAIVGTLLFVVFFLPFFVQAWTLYKCIKQGTFDNVRSGLFLGLFSFLMVFSYIMIIPLILRFIAKRGFGTGMRGLIRKGKVGNN